MFTGADAIFHMMLERCHVLNTFFGFISLPYCLINVNFVMDKLNHMLRHVS